VWPVLQKRLHLREYKLSIIRHLKWCILLTPYMHMFS
jgi:hypothetical protein